MFEAGVFFVDADDFVINFTIVFHFHDSNYAAGGDDAWGDRIGGENYGIQRIIVAILPSVWHVAVVDWVKSWAVEDAV